MPAANRDDRRLPDKNVTDFAATSPAAKPDVPSRLAGLRDLSLVIAAWIASWGLVFLAVSALRRLF